MRVWGQGTFGVCVLLEPFSLHRILEGHCLLVVYCDLWWYCVPGVCLLRGGLGVGVIYTAFEVFVGLLYPFLLTLLFLLRRHRPVNRRL